MSADSLKLAIAQFANVQERLTSILTNPTWCPVTNDEQAARCSLWFASFRHLTLTVELVSRGREIEAATLCRTALEGYAQVRFLRTQPTMLREWLAGKDSTRRLYSVRDMMPEPVLYTAYGQLSRFGPHLRRPILGTMWKIGADGVEMHLERSAAPGSISWLLILTAVATTRGLTSEAIHFVIDDDAVNTPELSGHLGRIRSLLDEVRDLAVERWKHHHESR